MSDENAAITRRHFVASATVATVGLVAAPGVPAASEHAARVPGPRTEVRPHLGRPMFCVDGRPYSKPVFETYVPETRFFRQFAAAGTDVFSFSTNLGPGFSSPTWLGPDQWDFRQLDQLALRVLEANPQGLLLPPALPWEFRESG